MGLPQEKILQKASPPPFHAGTLSPPGYGNRVQSILFFIDRCKSQMDFWVNNSENLLFQAC